MKSKRFDFVFVMAIILMPVSIFVSAFVMKCFWLWFVKSVFTSLPMIDMWQACGFSLFVNLFKIDLDKKISEKSVGEHCFVSIFVQTFLLILGFIFHCLQG